MSVRVLVVDDNELLRAGLVTVLASDPDLDVVGEAADGPSAVRLARDLGPDVVLMDVEMPGGDGITAIARLRERGAGGALPGADDVRPRRLRARGAAGGSGGLPAQDDRAGRADRRGPQLRRRATPRSGRASSPGSSTPTSAPPAHPSPGSTG